MSKCIEWQGAKDACGYGMQKYLGKTVRSHRLAYCQHHGLSLEHITGLVVRHRCDNPPCCNPEHLELGTKADNNRDRAERGRSAKTVPSRRKLNDAERSHVRQSLASVSALARFFRVDRKTIRNIRKEVS